MFCSLKLEMKVLRLHRIRVKNSSLFFSLISIIRKTKIIHFNKLFFEVYHNYILYTCHCKCMLSYRFVQNNG